MPVFHGFANDDGLLTAAGITLLAAPWCKLSLRFAFGCVVMFAPGRSAEGAGVAVMAVTVAWSRPVSGWHDRSGVFAGARAGITAGVLFHIL